MLYQLIRIWVKTSLHLFYKKIEVTGLENIPKGKPVIFLSNHQNTLMDALLLVTHIPVNLHFLARADIFQSSWAKPILSFFRIQPIYRIKDGFSLLKNGIQLFSSYVEVLKKKHSILLFPEGTHENKWIFRPLKKGYLRLLEHAKKEGVKDVVVIPVIIHYENHWHGKTHIWIEVGEAQESIIHEEISGYYQQNLLRVDEKNESIENQQKIFSLSRKIGFYTAVRQIRNNPETLANQSVESTLFTSRPVRILPTEVLATWLAKIPHDKQFALSIFFCSKMLMNTALFLVLLIVAICYLI